jgi:hypothetical protein
MNFLSRMEATEDHVELKYCERCGGLFLRPLGASVIHCGGCALYLAAEPQLAEVIGETGRRRSRPARLGKGPRPGGREFRGMAKIEYLHAVAEMEAWSC